MEKQALYLTKIKVSKKAAINNRLVDNYAWHKWIWKLFTDNDLNRRHKRRFLYRVDLKPAQNVFEIYLLSNGVIPKANEDYLEFLQRRIPETFLREQHKYRFSLRANPTKKYRTDLGGNRHEKPLRIPLYKSTDLRRWLYTQGQKHGFKILSLEEGRVIKTFFKKDGHRATIGIVDFNGILEISNLSLFKEVYSRGLGRAKAFGCGLFLLKPITKIK